MYRRIRKGRYWSYELDGRRVPGVTTFISEGVPKPALVDWAARCAAECALESIEVLGRLEPAAAIDMVKGAHRRVRNARAGRGTEVHRLAQALAEGQAVEVPPELEGYVDAYLAFIDEWAITPLLVELAIASRKHWYGGSADLVAESARLGGAALFDLKTGARGIYREACLQVSAYRHAEVMLSPDGTEVPMAPTEAGYAVWLRDDGGYELLPLETGRAVFSAFLAAKHLAGFMTQPVEELIGLPLSPPQEIPAA
jgi:hypothetical protein